MGFPGGRIFLNEKLMLPLIALAASPRNGDTPSDVSTLTSHWPALLAYLDGEREVAVEASCVKEGLSAAFGDPQNALLLPH